MTPAWPTALPWCVLPLIGADPVLWLSAGLRRVMVRAHRQAWCWQDEWYGLTMEKIRELEKEVQLMLSRKMAQFSEEGPSELSKENTIKDQATGATPEPSNSNAESLGRGLKKQWSTSSKSSRSSKRGGKLSSWLPVQGLPSQIPRSPGHGCVLRALFFPVDVAESTMDPFTF